MRLWLLLLFLLGATGAHAQGGPAWPIVQATANVAINNASSGLTTLITGVPGAGIYITAWTVMAGGTTNLTFSYGTGTNCSTVVGSVTGPYPLSTSNPGLTVGGGLGPVIIVPPSPAGYSLCINNSAGVQLSGNAVYAQY